MLIREKTHQYRILLIGSFVALITLLHYSTPLYSSFSHELFARFYYLPIILSGFWFGTKGGLLVSVIVTLLYLPHVWMGWGEGGAIFWDKLLEVTLFNIAGPTIGMLADMERRQRAQKDFISNTFGRYVDQDIARELMRRPEASRLGGEKREVGILISDLRNFTLISESLNPEATITMLNRYFSHMIDVVQRHKGIVVDFFGDGILVFFDPLDDPVAPAIHQAVHCASEMQREMESLNLEMKKLRLPELEMGIGLNAGQVVVGNIGSEARAKYGIVGSAVNITQRIQEVAKGGEVVLSESIFKHSKELVPIKESTVVKLRGVQDPLRLHLMDSKSASLAAADGSTQRLPGAVRND